MTEGAVRVDRSVVPRAVAVACSTTARLRSEAQRLLRSSALLLEVSQRAVFRAAAIPIPAFPPLKLPFVPPPTRRS